MKMQKFTLGCLLAFVLWGPCARATDTTLQDARSLAARVLTLLDARLALMQDVAAAKWLAGQAVGDPARETVVIAAAGERARALGLARAPVESLFATQIARAREIQSTYLDDWATHGTGPASARSLRDDLRPAIDQLTQDLLRALYLAAPYLQSAPLESIAATLPAGRWDAVQRANVIAALRGIHLDAERTPARMLQAQRLRIGVPADYAPFAWLIDNQLVGADIELTTRLAATLSVEPVFIRSSWATLLDDLAADHFDIAAGGISINAARRIRAGFSRPLVSGGKTAIGRCIDRARYTGLAAIDQGGVRVIENPGGTNEAFARRHLPHAKLTVYRDNIGIFQALADGEADVMITDDLEIARVVRREPRLCQLFDAVFEPAEKALLLPSDSNWQPVIDAALAPWLIGDGYPALLEHATAQ